VRRSVRWIGVPVLLLLAGALCDAGQSVPKGGVRRAAEPHTLPFVPGAPVQLAVLLQRQDCESNLRMLEILRAAPVRQRVHLSVLWFIGDMRDSTEIRRLLPAWTARTPLRSAPLAVVRQLRQLGHHHSPVLIAFDELGRIRLVSQSPASPREYAGLRRIIEGLTWIEPL
jgi:hypothetical protein